MQKDNFPKADISNGIIKAEILLPDTSSGYYRGTRFDWSGVISRLDYAGHNYFDKWFEIYSPEIHDAILGPVDAFVPVDYAGAKPGGKFLMIGVGVVQKPDEKPWAFSRTYPVLNYGSWTFEKGSDNIMFKHILNDPDYSYEYEKIVELAKDKPVMKIIHRLKNTGRNTLETLGYNHNFFLIDNQPVGPAYSAEYVFNISGVFADGPEIVKIEGNKFSPVRTIVKGETIFSFGLQGKGEQDKVYDIKIENRAAGAGVRITCDVPLEKAVFWANHTTFCPEPYIKVKAEPGEEFSWTITYEFYTLGK